ncbi:MAG: TatD family hydrolase [Bacilli bacterium]|nr:TatD family hydrolase [Bacilli bacterium]
MIIDTHCHLDIKDYDNLEEVIKNMEGNYMIASGYNLESNKHVIELVNKYDNIFGTIGLHPSDVTEDYESDLLFIESNINNPKIVGVGEIGLDYYWEKDNKELQKEVFIKQIELARKYNKTIVIHSREAILDTYNILDEYLGNNKAVLHCYSSNIEMAKRFKKFNIKFGISGVLTFKNSSKLKEVVKELNLSDLLLETDSPYLTPEPYRGKKNEPSYTKYVAEAIAKIKEVEYEKVLEITTQNAISQFDLNI